MTSATDNTTSDFKDLTADNITQHVINTCTQNVKIERTRELISKLIQHLHDYVREVKLAPGEWESGLRYLTEVGQYSTPDRQEMVLLSDVLGISALVDTLNSAQAVTDLATESSVLGPFHHEETATFENGESIAAAGVIGEPMLICGTVRDTDGFKIKGATVDIWETNGNGFYDMQDPDRDGLDCRGIFRTDSEGRFSVVGVKSVDYDIPADGPVGSLLGLLNRNVTRPAHVHFQIKRPYYIDLTTALYSRESGHITNDPVFGVKASLVKEFRWNDKLSESAKAGGVEKSLRELSWNPKEGLWVLEHHFVLLRR